MSKSKPPIEVEGCLLSSKEAGAKYGFSADTVRKWRQMHGDELAAKMLLMTPDERKGLWKPLPTGPGRVAPSPVRPKNSKLGLYRMMRSWLSQGMSLEEIRVKLKMSDYGRQI